MSAQSQHNSKHANVRLKIIPAPGKVPFVNAPPILIASTHTVDYGCGNCGTILLHAEPGQVHNLVIRCKDCGSYSVADT